MIKGQVFGRSAILADELVTQEQIETGKRRVLRGFHILLERDDRGQLQPRGGTSHFPLIMGNDVYPFKEHGLDRRLPRPERQRIVGQRRVIGVQHKRRAAFRVP